MSTARGIQPDGMECNEWIVVFLENSLSALSTNGDPPLPSCARRICERANFLRWRSPRCASIVRHEGSSSACYRDTLQTRCNGRCRRDTERAQSAYPESVPMPECSLTSKNHLRCLAPTTPQATTTSLTWTPSMARLHIPLLAGHHHNVLPPKNNVHFENILDARLWCSLALSSA